MRNANNPAKRSQAEVVSGSSIFWDVRVLIEDLPRAEALKSATAARVRRESWPLFTLAFVFGGLLVLLAMFCVAGFAFALTALVTAIMATPSTARSADILEPVWDGLFRYIGLAATQPWTYVVLAAAVLLWARYTQTDWTERQVHRRVLSELKAEEIRFWDLSEWSRKRELEWEARIGKCEADRIKQRRNSPRMKSLTLYDSTQPATRAGR